MIVYNTTFHIDKDVLADCLDYLKKDYLPDMIACGCLKQPSLRRVMIDPGEEGESYALQFHVADMDTLQAWIEREGSAIQMRLISRFGNKVVGFSTLLEEIDWEQ